MEHRAFFDKVSLMRKKQKEYFKTRSKAALEASKALEREIDNEIERVNKIIGINQSQQEPIQGNLFNNASKGVWAINYKPKGRECERWRFLCEIRYLF